MWTLENLVNGIRGKLLDAMEIQSTWVPGLEACWPWKARLDKNGNTTYSLNYMLPTRDSVRKKVGENFVLRAATFGWVPVGTDVEMGSW